MKPADYYIYKYCTIIIITASVFYYLSLEHLIAIGYSAPSVLIYRGILTFSLTVILSFKSRQKILPSNLYRQSIRIIIAGIALLLSFQSFKYLEAVTVSMIARLDIPFAVIIGFLTGNRKITFKVGLSIFALCMVLSIFFFARHIGEGPVGLGICILSVLLVSVSYHLVKKSTTEENNFVIVNTINVGCILVGFIYGLAFGNLTLIELSDVWIFAIASICQFILNYTMTVIYRHRDIAHGQRPYLLSALVLLVVEQVWHQRVFDPHHSMIVVLVIGVIYLITFDTPQFKYIWIKRKIEDSANTPNTFEKTSIIK